MKYEMYQSIILCYNGKCLVEEGQELAINHTTTTATTMMSTSKVDPSISAYYVAVVVSCICISLLISTTISVYYCKRKKMLCFSSTKKDACNVNKNAYVLSISGNISDNNNQQAPAFEIDSTDKNVIKLNEIYTKLLRREIDAEGLLYFYPKIKNNEMNFDELEVHIKNSQEFIITNKMPKSKTAFNYLESGKKI